MMGQIDSPERSVRNYQYTQRNDPEERRSQDTGHRTQSVSIILRKTQSIVVI